MNTKLNGFKFQKQYVWHLLIYSNNNRTRCSYHGSLRLQRRIFYEGIRKILPTDKQPARTAGFRLLTLDLGGFTRRLRYSGGAVGLRRREEGKPVSSRIYSIDQIARSESEPYGLDTSDGKAIGHSVDADLAWVNRHKGRLVSRELNGLWSEVSAITIDSCQLADISLARFRLVFPIS